MKMLLGLIAFGYWALSASAQEGAPRDTSNLEEFQQLAEQWRQACNSKDATTLPSTYAEDAQYISAHVVGYVADGRDRVIENFQNGVKSGGRIDTLEVLSVNSSCEMASIVIRYVGMAGGTEWTAGIFSSAREQKATGSLLHT
ncbi:MAG: hypothetical protein ACKVRP_03705 [Bacteroidota bacterium]